MSAAKSERVMNLLIALLSTKRYLTKAELREMVEGYRHTESFDRTFERDKAELRALGVVIRTGSNDPDSDDEDGYRIDRDDFELPEVEFSGAELVAIGLAAHAWQTSVGAEATATALQRLRAAGAEPDVARLPNLRAHIPVAEPAFDPIYRALLEHRAVRFTYDGRVRNLQPWRLLQRKGLWLVLGHDTDRGAVRRFKLARIEGIPEPVGPAEAFQPPADVESRLDAVPEVRAVVAVRDVPELLAASTPVAWDAPVPEGFVVVEVTGFNEPMLVTEIVAAGPDAIVLDPPKVRDAVVRSLLEWGGGQ